MIILVLSLFGLFQSGLSAFVQIGQCNPNIDLQNDFNYADIVGTWYELRTTDEIRDCSTYEFRDDNTVSRYGVNENFEAQINGTAAVEAETARLTVDWGSTGHPSDFWVLISSGTFVVAYGCENLSAVQHSVSLWILSRAVNIPPIQMSFINTTLITRLGIQVDDLRSVSRTDEACYALPLIEPGNPIILPGPCNENIAVVQDFRVNDFTGLWHEVSSYYSENSGNQCTRAEYTLNEGVVYVKNSQVVDQTLAVITGTAVVASDDNSARLKVTLQVENDLVEQSLWVLATDYISYAISYSCIDLPDNRSRVFSWILSRNRELSASAQAAVNEVIASEIVLNNQYYQPSDQSDEGCFYFPDYIPGAPVVFGGSCNTSIEVVTNFNVTAYMGTWHDIESYPSVFQTGTCRNANYELTDAVDVLNTQVIDEALDTMRGVAVSVSTDGSAKLDVTFPIAGTNATITTNYWILATDYYSYALVYSCVDIPERVEKQVWAWKLSRTKQLTTNAVHEIENALAKVNVLNNTYFEPVNQTRAGCFYFPEPQPGKPVIFPGQCEDDDVNVVQNFNLTQFGGIWYEIQAYPKDQQQGQCISHTYTGEGNTLDLQSSSVVDQFLEVSNGTLSFTNATDGPARLTITLHSGIEIPFWILATNYEDYALAYSCVNRDEDYRAIYSWKLSRTRDLPPAASLAISNAMSSVTVLDDIYFEDIGQSDEACFYLPDLAPGEDIILPGQCDRNITVVENFNPEKYLGTWRLVESYPSQFQFGECNDATYTLNPNNTVNVFNTEVIDQSLATIEGWAEIQDDGKLLVHFPNAGEPTEYYVLDTDYDSYALVYSCRDLDNNRRQVWSWKMGRTRSLSPEAVAAINQKIDTINVLHNNFYEQVNNTDEACFYFPDYDDSVPVRFRGRCDQTIPTVQDFNATAYLGLWHNIQLYPSVFQGGSCSNARYSLGDGVVDVFNTQVLNQTLDTMTGTAVVVSEDGSAKLSVTFPITGTNLTVTTNYWVLATDYSTYSLVYTCEEIDEEYRLVYSWKLSRTKELTSQAEIDINAVTNNIQVLDDRYYSPVDQSPAGCFYFPEPQPGKPVIFPGQCQNDINVVSDFDLSAFQGIWHEIEAYPKEQQQDECIRHEYTLGQGNTSLNLESSQVANLSLIVNNGVLSFNSADNSARMTINIIVDGIDISIPFWILSTDYTDYALAYSCVDLEDDHRGIYSWKLSRNRVLSNEAAVSINSVINTIDVLDNIYYERIDQSDEACFYLPVLAPGEPAVFRGRCDRNITVVENFNPERYLGTWRLVESYPSQFQFGECNDATYTLNPNNTVNVFNTEVIDQSLATIEGWAEIQDDGKLLVHFPNAGEPTEYYVLATDYDYYALVYSCRDLDDDRRQVWSWKMGRTRSLPPDAVAAINQKIDTINVLDNNIYEQVNNTDEACFYFPDRDDSVPVRFRGRCDQTIPTVPDFNATAYLGLWHNIQLYPSVFQGGSCSNARYSLGDDVVDVFNTQVLNQTLDTMTGTAVVVSEDGSAKLSVTFPVTGTNLTVTTNYWVLATDYSTYSLVYTCEEIDEEYRLVYSWKLSRTKELTPQAQVDINAVTNNIQVLDDRYYSPVDQSPAGCFYFPEPQPGKPVIFPGQCQNDINVVSDFDLSAFQGIWHEIEAYPKEQQQDECIRHEYTLGQGNASLNLESSQVANLSLIVNNGVLSFNSADNSARMTININVDGIDISIPFWILSTDYTDYALAYSCVDLEDDHRGIYSWKLSRNRVLSNEAAVSINSVINDIDVLDNIYYERIDQSDEACFYLPVLAPGEPAIFRGRCDENISGVPNFNASRYLGVWRSIETYPSEFQGGTCIQATYTASDNGVIVFNTQVLNQTLDTMTGTATVGSNDGTGLLLVNFPTSPEVSRYYILATDYDTYSFVYSCRNIGDEERQVWAWKLSRERELSAEANNAIDQVVDRINVLNERYFENIPQTQEACFYYPEPNGAVTFRGQCDPNVTVVSNFDLPAYMDKWYDIESFPQNFQDGTCPTANYTLADGEVLVYNTQVINQQLDDINAVAVPSVTDGSAKFDVTFPVAGTDLTITQPYWVLATDYNNYALVYSCSNLDDDSYRVTSWKLSRERSLSPASTASIAAAQQNVKELLDQYYVARGHSDENCFFYPDNNGGPVLLDGQCEDDDVAVVNNFDISQFAGSWYEIERFPSNFQNGECVANQFESNQDGLSINTRAIYQERLNTLTGQLSPVEGNNGVLSASLSNVTDTSNVYVLDVDYEDYALLFSCRNYDSNRKQLYSWKLSRSQLGLSSVANQAIDEIVTNRTYLFQNYYEVTGQDSNACFYYPVFEQRPNTIRLPGLCDNSIRGVPNFDAAAYLGRWYEIASYPEPNQFGECVRAYYSLGNEVVDVVNTQVANRTLFSQPGEAVVASDDGSGLLEVTFVVNGETRKASYYILDTDYTSYALVYNCQNLPDIGERDVFSWKLSRTDSLGNAANAAIDAVIDTTQGLLEEYYEPTSQAIEECFYVPEFVPEQTLRFRGRCENFTGLFQNFEPQRFLRRWHEISRYPSEESGGNCVSTRYEADGNTIRFEGTRVFGINDGRVATGIAIMDTNGLIMKVYEDGSTEVLWVVATDYENYALLFSCENIDDEYMGVWSAKYSSTRSLSTSSANALEPVIENNDLLYQQFFADVSQTESSCFYYPEESGQSVILPGQCNPNIQTQEEFDLTAYSGTWYQIERYPYPQIRENSTCIGTRYTQRDSNSVDVLNWEINGDLHTISGVATVNESAVLHFELRTGDGEDDVTTADLYVLSTDYISYSLVYTCVNLDEYRRIVVAIKLSRTRELPGPAQTTINNIILNTEELHQPYFIPVSQEDCWDPSSSYLIKSSIIVTLLCFIIQTLL